MSFELPPAVKLAERMLLEVEQAVRRFPRFHKYSHGALLRQQAMRIGQLAHRAWRDRPRQGEWLNTLVWEIDDFKLSLQLGKQIQAFASFRQFEQLSRLTDDLGRQIGGWYKQQHSKGQNAKPRAGISQRAEILSTGIPSTEGNR